MKRTLLAGGIIGLALAVCWGTPLFADTPLDEARKTIESLKGKPADALTTEELSRLIDARKIVAEHERKFGSALAVIERYRGRRVDELKAEELEAYLAARKVVGDPRPLVPVLPPIAGPSGLEKRDADAKDMLGIWTLKREIRGTIQPSAKLEGLDSLVIVLPEYIVTFRADGSPGRTIPYKLGKSAADHAEIEIRDLAASGPYVRMCSGVMRASSHRLQIAFVRGMTTKRDDLTKQLDGAVTDKGVFVWQLERREQADLKTGKRGELKRFAYAEIAKAFADLESIQGTWETEDPRGPRLTFDRGDLKIQDGPKRPITPQAAGWFALNPLTEPKSIVMTANLNSIAAGYTLDKDKLVLVIGNAQPADDQPPIGPGPGGVPPGLGSGFPGPGGGYPGPGGLPGPGGIGPGGPMAPVPLPSQPTQTIVFRRVMPKK